MDSPVSAFAIYKTTQKSKPKQNKNKKKKKAIPKTVPEVTDVYNNVGIPETTVKKAAEKIKKQQKKEKHAMKEIGKRKSPKKKKSKELKERTKKCNEISKKKGNSSKDIEEVPVLVPANLRSFANLIENQPVNGEDAWSNTSTVDSFEFAPVRTDSSEQGLKVFKWMIAPYSSEDFFKNVWEKKPLHIARKKPTYYSELLTTPAIDGMLRNNTVLFTKNLDITSYRDGQRETHNEDGRANPHVVWDQYLNGCSIRLLNPQVFIPQIHLLNATLQEYFNTLVGANAYLTPPDSQGFAPHYDDIEAFILQTEGKKHWRLYKPLDQSEILPRVSSKNFDQDEIGEPIMEVTLEAGDMIYFPRGYIHQGVTIDGEHSLHLTVSMYQKHSWADLFESIMPASLQQAIAENVEFRQGLPLDIYDHLGNTHSDSKTPRRKELKKFVLSLFDKIKEHLEVDMCVDEMGRKFQYDALPPILSDMEKAVTVYGDTDVMVENGKVVNRVEFSLDTRIRLLRKNILRVCTEDVLKLYYYSENSTEYHAQEQNYMELDENTVSGVDSLIVNYPEYIAVENLDMEDDTAKIELAETLWSKGLIMTEFPLENIDDDDE